MQGQVAQWELSVRRNLESACGHSVDSASLLPYLKLAPTCGPRTAACPAVGSHPQCSSSGGLQEGTECVQSQETLGQTARVAQPQTVCAVRVFLVAQEAVGRLPACVHVHVEVGDVEQGTCQRIQYVTQG